MLDRTNNYYDPPPRRRRRGPPRGYEHLKNVKWDKLTPEQIDFVCAFSDGLDEIRMMELDLLRLGTVDRIQAICVALRELRYCS